MLINWMLKRWWTFEDALAQRVDILFDGINHLLMDAPEYREETVSGRYALKISLIGGVLLAGIVCMGLVV